jgi:hypothetical protein
MLHIYSYLQYIFDSYRECIYECASVLLWSGAVTPCRDTRMALLLGGAFAHDVCVNMVCIY